MTAPAARLAVTVALFLGWIGYLAYQVATRPTVPSGHPLDGLPLVLSRPQVETSELDVVASVPSAEGAVKVTVKEVLYQRKGPGIKEIKPGDELTVSNIGECKAPRRGDLPPPPPDWQGPGDYLLPLSRQAHDGYVVTGIPPSPGYSFGLPRIYPRSQQALAQYREIGKPPAE